MIWTIRREALKVGHGVCLSWHSRIALEAGALTAAGVSWRIVSASIKIQRPGRTCWEPNSGLLSTSIGTKMQTCGWRPDLCANGPQSALCARSEPQSYGGKCTAMYCFASSLFTVVPQASFWSNSCQVFFMDFVSIANSCFLGPTESAWPYICAVVMLHMVSFPTHPSALSVYAPMPLWSVSSHVRCCIYICGQDVSRRMRPRYFPDAVLQ